MVEEDRRLVITDEKGNEIEMEIMFTFEKDGKNYVVYHDPSKEGEMMDVFASIYDDQGNLFPIESDEEWEMIEEMLEAFANDEEEEEK